MQTNHDQGCATASRRGLFVTYLVPTEPERSASGIYRRQRMLTEAMAQTCDEIDILYFVQPHESNPDLRSPARVAELLFGDFSGTLHVEICDRMAPRRASSVWYSYLRPTTGLCRMPGYESFAGRAQVAAFERALARRPDFVLVHRLMCMPPVLRASPPLPPLFLDLDDVEHIAFARSIAHPPPLARQEFAVPSLAGALPWRDGRTASRAQGVRLFDNRSDPHATTFPHRESRGP